MNSAKIQVLVIMGVAGSGKTTIGTLLSYRLGWQFADADDFHPPENVSKMKSGNALTDEDREPWLEALSNAIKNWLSHGKRAVLACSALKETYRERLTVDKQRVAFVYLRGDFTTIEERLSHRKRHFMKAGMLKSQLEALEEPRDAVSVDITKSPPEVVDEIVEKLDLD